MKLSTAIIVLTSALAEASAGNRRARRRTQDTITTDFADSVVNADKDRKDDPTDCKQQEVVTSIVHITAPAAEEGESSAAGYGGFVFEYNSKLESVEFKGAAGSNFDFSVCMTFKDDDVCNRSIARRLGEDNFGTVEGDKDKSGDDDASDCEGKDTILYCPLKKDQSASFQLTDTISYCSDPSVEVASDIKFYVSTPVNDASSEEECGGAAIVAAQGCGPTTFRGFEQTTRCLNGNNNEPLGAQYTFDLQRCAIWAGETPAVITGSDTPVDTTGIGGTGIICAIVDATFGPDYQECLADNGYASPPYWFERDVKGIFVFTEEEASVGSGSFKGEIGTADDEKVTLEYWSGTDDLYDRPLSDLEYIQFDFFPKTGTCTGCPDSCGSSFYLNLKTRATVANNNFFDCSFDYVPDECPEGEWTTFKIDLFGPSSTVPARSNGLEGDASSSNGGCVGDYTIDGSVTPTDATTGGNSYVLGTGDFATNTDTGYIFTINVGDTSGSDNGLVGYIDNIQVKLKDEANARVYDLEPGSV